MNLFSKEKKCFLIFTFLLLFPYFINAQQIAEVEQPKIGLVLSGGGAKGFAHIGALKVFQEAGLHFDYIGGTSMGSIVGSLYAIGYHPDTIAKMVQSQNWDDLLNDRLPRKYIPIEEKRNSDRFIITFPLIKGKLTLKQGLHSGQMVELLLSKYLSPAYKTVDFSELPTPFLCVATDLIDGSNVVLKNGNLQKAIRASMSLPSFFSPVKLNGHLLVDGGVINNFPVAEVKQEGVKIIVGVDVQPDLYPESGLNSPIAILDQVTSFYRVEANVKAVKLTDLYIKPELEKFGVMDFDDYNAIMLAGEIEARKRFPQLKALADSLNAISVHTTPKLDARPLDSIFITFIQYNGLKRVSRDFLDGALDIKLREWVQINDLDDGIKRAFGSGFFEKINYYFIPIEEGAGLVLDIIEASTGILGVGIHYDSDYNVSLLLNGTFKNVGIKGSKWFTDLSLGENPRLQSLYLVDRGTQIGFGSRLTFFNLGLNEYDNNSVVDVINISQNMAEMFAQWTYRNTMRFQAGIAYEYIRFKSSFNQQIPNDFNSYGLGFLKWSIDTYDKNQFSTSGQKLEVTVKYIMPIGQSVDKKRFTNSLIFLVKHHNNIEINEKNTFKPGIIAGFTAIDNRPPPQHYFIVGGQSELNYFNAFLPFTGLRFIENVGLYTLMGNFAWQYNVHKNLYITAKWDLGYVTSTFEEMLNKPVLLSGFGVTFGYNSYIGPIEFSLMGSNVNTGMSNFVNIGFWF